MRAGLKALPESVDIAYVTSCDVPLLVPGFVSRMIDLLGDHDIAVMEIDGFAHPLSAVYRRNTLPHVESLLAQDKLRPVFLFDAVRTRRVQPEEMTLRRSATSHVAEPEYPGGLRGGVIGGRLAARACAVSGVKRGEQFFQVDRELTRAERRRRAHRFEAE